MSAEKYERSGVNFSKTPSATVNEKVKSHISVSLGVGEQFRKNLQRMIAIV